MSLMVRVASVFVSSTTASSSSPSSLLLLQRAAAAAAARRLSSTTTMPSALASSSTSSRLRIVSRRAWNARPVLNSKSGTSSSSSTTSGTDDKPWPKSVIVGRNVALSLLIPYTMAWFLSMHEPSRKTVDSVVPGVEQRLREYFGMVQHDGIAYPDVVAGVVPIVYQLDGEPPLQERTQQGNIQQLLHADVPVTMTLDTNAGTVTKKVVLPGTVPVTPEALLATATSTTTTTNRVAVDFEDVDPIVPTTVDDGTLTMDDSSLSNNNNNNNNPITQQHHTYSSWFYQAPAPPPTSSTSSTTTASSRSSSSSTTMSNMELEICELEYTVATLEAELNNTSSTRNMDDMRQELAEAKSQLRSARWKKRFGLGQ